MYQAHGLFGIGPVGFGLSGLGIGPSGFLDFWAPHLNLYEVFFSFGLRLFGYGF